MATDADILFPNREVKIRDGETVTVKELSWPEALAFLRELGGYLGKLINDKGEVRMDVALIVELVTSTDELTNSLIKRTTGKDPEWLKTIPMSAALEIIDTALALNLSDELIEKGKAIAGRFRKWGAPALEKVTPTSSPTDTTAGS